MNGYNWFHQEGTWLPPCFAVFANNGEYAFCFDMTTSHLYLVEKANRSILMEVKGVLTIERCGPYVQRWSREMNLTIDPEHILPLDDAVPEDINVSGWIIQCQGDPSVGIPDGTWDISGEMTFQDKEEMEAFRSLLSDAFSIVCDSRPGVMTSEEAQRIDELCFPPRPEVD